MKKIFISAFLLITVNAFGLNAQATDVTNNESRMHYTFFGNHMGNYTMVSCDYAQYVVWDFMTKFGAKNVSTFCSGGIQPYGVFPINLDIRYEAPDLNGETRVESVDIMSRPWDSNCVFDTDLLDTLVREMPNVKKVSGHGHCFSPRDRYSYRFEVTGPVQ